MDRENNDLTVWLYVCMHLLTCIGHTGLISQSNFIIAEADKDSYFQQIAQAHPLNAVYLIRTIWIQYLDLDILLSNVFLLIIQ